MMRRFTEHMTEYFFGHLKESEDQYLDDDFAQYLFREANAQLKQLTKPNRKKTKKAKKK